MFERIKKLFNRQPKQPQPAVLRHEMADVDHTTAAVVFTIMGGAPYMAILGRGENAVCVMHDMNYDEMNDTLIGMLRTMANDNDNKALRDELTNLIIDLNR